MTYLEYCKAHIVDNIGGYEGTTFMDSWDLSNSLTHCINMDGTATYNYHDAIDYIRDWYYDLGDFVNYHDANVGDVGVDPFNEPERFHVVAIIYGVEDLMRQVLYNYYDNNLSITLDAETIANILAELDKITAFAW